MFESYVEQGSWVLNIGNLVGTTLIALFFVFLIYIMQPTVAPVTTHQRVKAYRQWHTVAKGQTVEVSRNLPPSVRCFRRAWKVRRVSSHNHITAVFLLGSWFLDLLMDFAHITASVTDVYLRPPPVLKRVTDEAWNVSKLAAQHTLKHVLM